MTRKKAVQRAEECSKTETGEPAAASAVRSPDGNAKTAGHVDEPRSSRFDRPLIVAIFVTLLTLFSNLLLWFTQMQSQSHSEVLQTKVHLISEVAETASRMFYLKPFKIWALATTWVELCRLGDQPTPPQLMNLSMAFQD